MKVYVFFLCLPAAQVLAELSPGDSRLPHIRNPDNLLDFCFEECDRGTGRVRVPHTPSLRVGSSQSR